MVDDTLMYIVKRRAQAAIKLYVLMLFYKVFGYFPNMLPGRKKTKCSKLYIIMREKNLLIKNKK